MQDISAKAVRAQLERIMNSPEFVNGPRLCRFLLHVVNQTLDGHSERIKQYTIAVDGLGYGSDFDAAENTTIRNLAGRVRRALERYYANQGHADPIRIDIPKGTYVPVFEPNSNSTRNAEPASEPTLCASATTESEIVPPNGPSIAVLQLEMLDKDPDHAFLSSGISEEITIALTRFPTLVVIGPLNRDIICQKQLEPRGIGREYDARFVLDGTVRLRERTLRISARLTDTITGCTVWARRYDCDIETTTIAQLEDDIVEQVVGEIADAFGVIHRMLAEEMPSRHDESLSAYEAVLRFHHYIRTLTENSMTEAVLALEQVVQGDPHNDHAMALLADLVGVPYIMGYVDDMSGLERAETLARKALTMNRNSQEAHYAVAQIHYQRFEPALCLAAIERILELNPRNSHYLAVSSLFLTGLGQRKRGLALMKRAMRQNPHHPGWYHVIPFLYHYHQGDYEAALVEADQMNMPEYFWDPLIRTAVLSRLGRQAEAQRSGCALLALVPDFQQRGRSLIKRMLFLDEHVDMIWDALLRAGVQDLPAPVHKFKGVGVD